MYDEVCGVERDIVAHARLDAPDGGERGEGLNGRKGDGGNVDVVERGEDAATVLRQQPPGRDAVKAGGVDADKGGDEG